MKRLALLMSVVFCLCVMVAVTTTDVAAQTLRPCCEGGRQENKPCTTDAGCKGVCVGGSRDGKPCNDDSRCATAVCIGGANDGDICIDDADCPGGSCGPVGFCDQGTCTALCVKGKPPKSPSEPASEWLDFEAARQVSVQHTCP